MFKEKFIFVFKKKATKAVSDYCGDDNDYEIIDDGSYQSVMMVMMMTLMVMMFMKVLKVLTKAGSDIMTIMVIMMAVTS